MREVRRADLRNLHGYEHRERSQVDRAIDGVTKPAVHVLTDVDSGQREFGHSTRLVVQDTEAARTEGKYRRATLNGEVLTLGPVDGGAARPRALCGRARVLGGADAAVDWRHRARQPDRTGQHRQHDGAARAQ